jgi:hypothetical protein
MKMDFDLMIFNILSKDFKMIKVWFSKKYNNLFVFIELNK